MKKKEKIIYYYSSPQGGSRGFDKCQTSFLKASLRHFTRHNSSWLGCRGHWEHWLCDKQLFQRLESSHPRASWVPWGGKEGDHHWDWSGGLHQPNSGDHCGRGQCQVNGGCQAQVSAGHRNCGARHVHHEALPWVQEVQLSPGVQVGSQLSAGPKWCFF